MNAQERIDAVIAARPQATPGPWVFRDYNKIVDDHLGGSKGRRNDR